jgi:hypothetical protein
MNLNEHLFTCLNEELSEAIKASTKCQRFGPNAYDTNFLHDPSNIEHLVVELNHVLAVASRMAEAGLLPDTWINLGVQEAKQQRLTRMIKLSAEKGTLQL